MASTRAKAETVQNRTAAQIQITAEQLIADAKAQFGHIASGAFRAREGEFAAGLAPTDEDELAAYLQNKRKSHEERLRKNRSSLRAWLDYARFEAQQNDYRRARSVLERASNVFAATHHEFWLSYAEIEAKGGFVNHALNVMHRAVGLMPRVNALWFRYLVYEQALGDVERTRDVFERWMTWSPPEEAWFAYVEFEERVAGQAGDHSRSRDVFERYCGTHPTAKAYCKYAKWEEQRAKRPDSARRVFERAAGVSDEDESPAPELTSVRERSKPDLWLSFAAFEARQGETERARGIYQYALTQVADEVDKGRVFTALTSFEKRSGGGEHADSIVVERRRREYERAVELDARDYDAWFDWLRLEESVYAGAPTPEAKEEALDKIRALYARAQAHPPPRAVHGLAAANAGSSRAASSDLLSVAGSESLHPAASVVLSQAPTLASEDLGGAGPSSEKRVWRRFVYFYIHQALFEELECKSVPGARAAYRRGLQAVPHDRFTFAKLWILAAQLELRARDLPAARKLLGNALGRCPKDKVFRTYIQLELQLGQVDRCRALYEKYLAWNPGNAHAWASFAELEAAIGEEARARAIFELGVDRSALDEPEKLWTRYIDFEIALDTDEARARAKLLYERLVARSKGHPRVWAAYAKFLAMCEDFGATQARSVMERAVEDSKARQDAVSRAALLRAAWDLERAMLQAKVPGASEEAVLSAEKRLPRRSQRSPEGEEEWVFPEDEVAEPSAPLVEAPVEEPPPQDAGEARAKRAATSKLMEMALQWKRAKMENPNKEEGDSSEEQAAPTTAST